MDISVITGNHGAYMAVLKDLNEIRKTSISTQLKEKIENHLIEQCVKLKLNMLNYICQADDINIDIDLILEKIEKKENNNKSNIVNQNKIETYDVENIENEINIKKKVDSQYNEWRKKVQPKIRIIYNRKICYIESKEIIREIYRDMTIRYGIVWEQEYKEWKRDYVKNPTTMEIIYYNENYRSIFESILDDMVTKAINDKYEELTLSEIAQPLVIKDNDTSKGGSTTLRKIYKDMETRCNINWEKRAKKYAKIAEIPVENVTKRSIVCSESGLLENFRISMYLLLNN